MTFPFQWYIQLVVAPDSKVHVAHLGPLGPSWAPCWLHEPCYQGGTEMDNALEPKNIWPIKPGTSTVYWCIASKLKVPLFFVMEWIKRFCGWVYNFSISLTLVVLQRQKSLPDIGGTTIQDVGCHLAVMRAGVHIMSDELILKILCNIFQAFKWILMMTSGQNISHYTTAKLSLHVWNHDLIWWQNKIDTQKHFRKITITSSWTLSKTKIPIAIVKAQMPSNPNQKARTRDNDCTDTGNTVLIIHQYFVYHIVI